MADQFLGALRIQGHWRPVLLPEPDIVRAVAEVLALAAADHQRLPALPLQGDGFQRLHGRGGLQLGKLQKGIAEGGENIVSGDIHLSVPGGKIPSAVHGRVLAHAEYQLPRLYPAQRGIQAVAGEGFGLVDGLVCMEGRQGIQHGFHLLLIQREGRIGFIDPPLPLPSEGQPLPCVQGKAGDGFRVQGKLRRGIHLLFRPPGHTGCQGHQHRQQRQGRQHP